MENNYQWPPQEPGKPPKKQPNLKKAKRTAIVAVIVFLAGQPAEQRKTQA